jgi:hypothetical protein
MATQGQSDADDWRRSTADSLVIKYVFRTGTLSLGQDTADEWMEPVPTPSLFPRAATTHGINRRGIETHSDSCTSSRRGDPGRLGAACVTGSLELARVKCLFEHPPPLTGCLIRTSRISLIHLNSPVYVDTDARTPCCPRTPSQKVSSVAAYCLPPPQASLHSRDSATLVLELTSQVPEAC